MNHGILQKKGINTHAHKLLDKSEITRWIEFKRAMHPACLKSIPTTVWPEMDQKCSTYQRPGNYMNSEDHDQKLIMPGVFDNECVYQVWGQSGVWFVWKCVKFGSMTDRWSNIWMNEWMNEWMDKPFLCPNLKNSASHSHGITLASLNTLGADFL